MSDAPHCHAMSGKLKRDSEMCVDSFGVANHSRGHLPSTDSAVRGVPCKHCHLHGITSVVYSDRPGFFMLTLATGHCEPSALAELYSTCKLKLRSPIL